MKKSMSGLIITVLLVAIAVALTAMFVGFISSLSGSQLESTRTQTQKLEMCRKVQYDLLQLRVTNNSNDAQFYIVARNYGQVAFDGFRVRPILKDGSAMQYFEMYFQGGKLGTGAENGVINITLTGVSYLNLSSIEIYPLINITSPYKDTLRCDEYMRIIDLTPYKQ
ncbi:MAG: hypothetical protein QXR30_02175 [Candidatus Woesearchaeota archaeon]